jgi:diamine N-acetyltransferase
VAPGCLRRWLIIDERYQRRGYSAEVARQIAGLVRAEGATELLTSYLPEPGAPAGFYQRLGFVPTGDIDENGEIVMRLAVP